MEEVAEIMEEAKGTTTEHQPRVAEAETEAEAVEAEDVTLREAGEANTEAHGTPHATATIKGISAMVDVASNTDVTCGLRMLAGDASSTTQCTSTAPSTKSEAEEAKMCSNGESCVT